MRNLVVNPNMLKDAAYYTRSDSGATCDKAQGVIIGIVSALMACGYTYHAAIGALREALPANYRDGALPPAWAYDIIHGASGSTRTK